MTIFIVYVALSHYSFGENVDDLKLAKHAQVNGIKIHRAKNLIPTETLHQGYYTLHMKAVYI